MKIIRIRALLAVVALTAIALPTPASAAPVLGEAKRTDTYLSTTSLSNGYDAQQGYAQLPAADYHDGGGPDCIVTTGRSPNGGANIPAGIVLDQRDQDSHRVRGINQSGNAIGANFSYWIHTAQDDPSDTHTVCGNATVATDASGYFTVTFPHTLSTTPAAVVASGSTPTGGPNIPSGVVIRSRSASGFTGRAINQLGNAIASGSVGVDYWATDQAARNDATYWHRAGQVSVTTDASGFATINHADFNAGQTPSSAQVTGSTYGGPYITAGVVAYTLSATSAGVRLLNQQGNAIANQTVSVNYIISGPIGGSPRRDADVDFTQLWNNNTGFECGTGSPNLDACIRYPLGEPAYQYRRTSAFAALGSVGGTDHDVWFRQSLADWEAKDVRLPQWTETTTVGAEELLVDAANLGTGICAQMGPSIGSSPTYSDGLNFITTGTLTTSTAASFVPWTPGFSGCAVDWTYRHELGHAWGLGHNARSDASIMGGYYDGSGVEQFDVDSARALYGYSGSLYRSDLRVSHFVELPAGLSGGLVTVSRVGATRELPDGQLVTAVEVRGTDWVGDVPSVVEVPGGWVQADLGPVLLGALTDGPSLAQMVPGARFVVQVRDADARLLDALPAPGRNAELRTFYGATDGTADDDVDGGDPRVVDLDALRARARRI